MPTYKTPGVYIEEISKLPPSVAAVETAIPVFIGFTEKAVDDDGSPLSNKPKRLTSLLEYEKYFGVAPVHDLEINVAQSGTDITVAFPTKPELPARFLYYSMQMYFANGGGPAWIVSIGDYVPAPTKAMFTDVLPILEGYDEPTLLVFPDSCLLSNDDHGAVVTGVLQHCKKMQDRFAIIDVRDAKPGGTVTNQNVTANFRGKVTNNLDEKKYGAAYFPFLRSLLPFNTADDKIKFKTAATGVTPAIAANATLQSVQTSHTAVYSKVKQFLASQARVVLPPSGGVAGVYARVDKSRGVWKAPANESLNEVFQTAVEITNDLNDGLNVDATTGKSVNAIRAFTGKGILVWGARTLAGNDNENRYVPVRRFLNFAEESIKKATGHFVFEPNDANTWVKVRSMIESFLTKQWRDGALAGAKPQDAFYVSVGLNQTMSAQDVLEGRMIVEIGLAIVRPAEFIILQFVQMQQKS
jgi:Bacteriophage tail sheath protein